MLASLLGLTLVTCTPLGPAVADRVHEALPKPAAARALSGADAHKKLRALERKGQTLGRRTIDRAHYRQSSSEALDDFAALVEEYLHLVPRLPPAEVLTAIHQLIELTNWIERLIDVGPPDWPEGTWEDYRDALGCQSKGRPLIELGLRFAHEHDLQGPARRRLEDALRRLEHETIDF